MDPCSFNVELCINNRDGTKRLYVQPAGKNENTSDLKTIVSSLQKIQKEVNSQLTVIVEKDKSTLAISTDNGTKTASGGNDIDEELEEDDEDDKTNCEPVIKKLKR